jgi:hypothetical protein
VTSAFVPTTKADLEAQRWLDRQIEAIETGVEAVVNIARNWTDGMNLGRLHPGVSAAEYVTARVGTLGKSVVPVLLAESNWSNRQIAAVAGVSVQTVGRVASTVPNGTVDRPTLGADNKVRSYPPRIVEAVVIDGPVEMSAAPRYIDSAPPSAGPSQVLRRFEAELRRIRGEYAELAEHPRARRFHNVFAAIDAALG